ncbi:SIALI-17 repeat-containing surface protein, partial [Streptococcus mitis]|uniref:SIALI-17 repeat-containing surface protein n=1 Tax=Streptococcus mitis TaxID=28037 RepID=UPI0039C20669
ISVTDQNDGVIPDGTKVTLPGVKGDHTVQDGKVVISNDDLPDAEESGKGSIEEAGKFPSQSTDNVTVPAKKVSAKGNPAVDFIVRLPLPIVVPDSDHLTPQEIEKLVDEVKKSNPNTIVTADDKGNVTVTDQATGESLLIPVKDLTVPDFEPVTPTDKVPVKDLNNLSKDEQDKVKESVEKANPGKDVTVDETGKAIVTDTTTNVSHEIPRDELLFTYAKGEPEVLENPEFNGGVNAPDSPIHELPEFNGGVNGEPEVQAENPGYNGPIGTTGVDENGELIQPPVVDIPEFNGAVNGELPEPTELPKIQLIITKWIDEQGHELKPADTKAPSVPGEANEAFEHGEIEGYVFVRTETKGDVVTHVFRKVSPARPTGDGQQRPTTPSDDTNPRPDTSTPAEVPATQPTKQPSQTVEVPAQLPNEVSETNPSVSQPQAVLPNTGTQEDHATGALGALSLLGAFGLLFAKKKKDDEEDA